MRIDKIQQSNDIRGTFENVHNRWLKSFDGCDYAPGFEYLWVPYFG